MSLVSMRCQLRLKENKNLKNSKTGFKENRIHLTHTHKEMKEENGSAIYGLAAAADERVDKKIGMGRAEGNNSTEREGIKRKRSSDAQLKGVFTLATGRQYNLPPLRQQQQHGEEQPLQLQHAHA